MELLKESINWAQAEVFSSAFFIFFAMTFLFGGVGFWHLGKTEISKAYVTPMLVVGFLLLIIGGGLLIGNKLRISKFEASYKTGASQFVDSELERADKTMKEYRLIVFKVIPFMIIICALLIIFFDKPIWRASSISTLAMLVVILLIDGTAKDRIESYEKKLVLSKKHVLKEAENKN